ncbi:NAD(P)-dependent oxidoreductase [Pontibacter silvestris]|uniref:NAD(P)-dependent oxidoreductase n=1 Tax=Pontibacter silvestris TaxID=2305183 RepID=A0ABW4WYZ8_9BACT|nr:NAD(P)-dependent oxidoreductase [Pontibacter silvestris]MCC9135472.1 NAD(P)-dependent oxidoreductase [Pontibacter silvestris]
MKIAIIGASGHVGSKITSEALNRGHKVTAIVRHPENITRVDKDFVLLRGDVFNVDETADQIAGHDALVVSYSPGWGPGTDYHKHVKAAEAAIAAAKKAGVKRLISVGGAGSLYVGPDVQAVDTPEFPADWKEGASAQRDSLEVYKKENELDWTFFCPAFMIGPGERTSNFRLGTENPVFDEKGESNISYEDYAVALVDELEDPQFIKKRFTIGY